MAIDEKTLGLDHPDLAKPLNNLAVLYLAQGRYAEAEPRLKHALAIAEKALGPNDPPSCPDPDLVWRSSTGGRGRYADAELPLKRALDIREQVLGPDHPDLAQTLNTLGALYWTTEGRYAEAEEPRAAWPCDL